MSEPWRAHRIRKVMHMQWPRREDEHLEQWIKVEEHYRLHCAERWPESDYKEAVLAAIHSTLKTLEAISLAPVDLGNVRREDPNQGRRELPCTKLMTGRPGSVGTFVGTPLQNQ